jgi:hypothetical protein
MCVPFSKWCSELVRALPAPYSEAPIASLGEECLDMWNEGLSPQQAADLVVKMVTQKLAEVA